MDTLILVVVAIVACVAVEMAGMRLYRRFLARMKAAFTRENAGEVYADLQSARAHCLAAKCTYRELAESACADWRAGDAALIEALAAAQQSHLEAIEVFRRRLHAEKVEPVQHPPLPAGLDEALRDEAARTVAWAEGFCREAAARARDQRWRDVAKLYRHLRESEQENIAFCLAVAEGAQPAEQLSRCPSCGLIVAGRRPAFCTVCTCQGFEFEEIRAEKLRKHRMLSA
ncbi:MAG: hypothetical protein RR178_04935 [Gordonibacter sp.]